VGYAVLLSSAEAERRASGKLVSLARGGYHGLGLAGPLLPSRELLALLPNRHAVLVCDPTGGLACCRARARLMTHPDQRTLWRLAAQQRPEADADLAALDPRSLGLVR
jgi:hypothetical protein